MNAIAGIDPNVSTSLAEPVPDFLAKLQLGVCGLKLGLPKEYFIEGLDPQVEKAVRAAPASLVARDAQLKLTTLSTKPPTIPTGFAKPEK